jgi:hypothetical protein
VRFLPNQPVETTTPTVVVDRGLAVGPHRFRLVVVTRDGRVSRPDEIVITVIERLRPLPP